MERLAQFQNALAERRVPAVAEMRAHVVLDKAGRPQVVAGNNALVARLRRADGGDVALRIVASTDKDRDLRLRYAALAEFQNRHDTVRLPSGITSIRDGLPILAGAESDVVGTAMEWIAGPTLLQGIDRAAKAGNVQVLRALSTAVTQLWNDLQDVEFIHGDLTAQNLVVRGNGQLASVDFDTASWSDAPLGPSGVGSPGYRHPTLYRDAGLRDAFAALVMLVSMAVLADAPDLRSSYGDPASTFDGTILFSAWDFANPSASRVFDDAQARVTVPTRMLLDGLRQACTGTTRDIQHACELLPRFRLPAMHPEASTAGSGWDVGPVIERIRAHYSDTWIAPRTDGGDQSVDPAPRAPLPQVDVHADAAPVAVLESVTSDDLSELKAALARNDESEVVRLWSQIGHDPLARLLAAEVESVIAAGYDRRVLSEWRRKRDLAVIAVAAEASDRHIPLGPQARSIARQAHERTVVRAELEDALAAGDRQRLAELAVSGRLVVLGDADRQALQQVLQAIEWPALQRAIETDDDLLISAAFDDELYEGVTVLGDSVRQRVALARERIQWLTQARATLAKRDSAHLRELLIDPPPGAAERLSGPERRRIRRSIERRHALAELDAAIRSDDDEAIIVSLNRIERVGARISDRATWARVQQVVERVSLIDELLDAAEAQPLDHARIAQLIPALKTLGLERDPRLGDDELVERLETHVIRMAHVRRIRAALSRDNDIAIVAAAVPDPRNALDMLSEPERNRVAAAIRARRAAERVRT